MRCREYRRRLGGWGELPAEMEALAQLPEMARGLSNYFAELPTFCLLFERSSQLEPVEGLQLYSVDAMHKLQDAQERAAAIEIIDQLASKVRSAFVIEWHALNFRSEELKKPGDFCVYVGWQRIKDKFPRLRYTGPFFEVRVMAPVRQDRARYHEAFWHAVLQRAGLQEELHVEVLEPQWFVRSQGRLRIRFTQAGFHGEDPTGLAVLQRRSLRSLQRLLDCFEGLGPVQDRQLSCLDIAGAHYEEARKLLNTLGPCWDWTPLCDLLPEDAQRLRQGQEPHSATRRPGCLGRLRSSGCRCR